MTRRPLDAPALRRLRRRLGPAHGLVGNVLALERAPDADAARSSTRDGGAARTDGRRRGRARELAGAGEGRSSWDGEIRVQWCAGAPGIVARAAYLDEELLLAGARLTWRAGPPGMEKGSGICHGTAGNGYAFLKVFERTGDEQWLDRARRFAVHALGQVGRRGHGRYSLWTGDVGVALYAADCLEPAPAIRPRDLGLARAPE